MSKIYEALKKASEESQGVQSAAHSQTGAMPGPTITTEMPANSLLEPQTRKQASARLQRNESETVSANGKDRDYLPLVNDARAVSAEEYFLSLAAAIRSSISDGGKRVVLVTSAMRCEGKSFVTRNLAASLVRISMPTLVIDADLRAPSNHFNLNLSSANGLLTFLEGRAVFSDCVHETSLPGLSILPSGGISRAPLETFASARMNELIANIRNSVHDHCVLVDSPPGLSVPDVHLFKHFVDGALIVVAANRTPRAAVTKMLELLREIPVLGLVLNSYTPSLSAKTYYRDYSSTSRDARQGSVGVHD
jgi:capsular exopolysaccharide synthesis family protein